MLPEEKVGTLSPADSARYERMGDARGIPRRIRASVRGALFALADMTGESLPPPAEDALRQREAGVQLASWSTKRGKGIYELVLNAGTAQWRHLDGREPLEPRLEHHAPLPSGWTVLIERLVGMGIYQVAEQPADSNGWTARLLLDDDWAPFNNPVELAIWAFPPE